MAGQTEISRAAGRQQYRAGRWRIQAVDTTRAGDDGDDIVDIDSKSENLGHAVIGNG
jgi:hypothetical protein